MATIGGDSVEEKQSKQMDQTEAELEKAKTKQKFNLTLSDDTQRDNSENRFWTVILFLSIYSKS